MEWLEMGGVDSLKVKIHLIGGLPCGFSRFLFVVTHFRGNYKNYEM